MKMSRCSLKVKEDHSNLDEIAIGIERGSWFFMALATDHEGYEVLVEDFEGGRGRVLELIDKYADSDDAFTKYVRDKVALDLDPCNGVKSRVASWKTFKEDTFWKDVYNHVNNPAFVE